MRRLLAATDLSERSDHALRRAIRLAAETGAGLDVLHVIDDDQPAELLAMTTRQAEEYLNRQVATFTADQAQARIQVRAGDPFRVIVDEAVSLAADLIVLGVHRRNLLRDVFIGTTLERVIRIGRMPVLMVCGDADRTYTRALAAVDDTPISENAVRTLRSFSMLGAGDVSFVHGHVPIGSHLLAEAGVEDDKRGAYLSTDSATVTADIRAMLDRAGLENAVDTPLMLIEAGPLEAIHRAIGRVRPDFVTVGTAVKSGLVRTLLGSTAEQLLKEAPCDVLTIPVPGAE